MKNANSALMMIAMFETMASDPSTSLKTVIQWLASNINLLGQVLFDKPGRALSGHCTFEPKIVKRDGVFYADVAVSLPFCDKKKFTLPFGRKSTGPDLASLEPYLKGVTFDLKNNRFSNEVRVIVTFDLRVWEGIVPSCLYTSIQLLAEESLQPRRVSSRMSVICG